LIELHLIRSYHILENEPSVSNLPFVRQINKMLYEDERGTVVRGPWDMTQELHSTTRGIIHPRVAEGSDTTFLVSPQDGATAWVQHHVSQDRPNANQGIMRGLGKGYEQEGFMVEMITSLDGNPRVSVGCIYDDAGRLRHVTLNREDRDGWPSRFWTPDVWARRLSPADVPAALGLTPAAAAAAAAAGHEVSAADVRITPIAAVGLPAPCGGGGGGDGDAEPVVLGFPDGVVVACPAAIPFGRPWAASVLWRPGGPAGGGRAVQALETRYSPAGAESFRHTRFAV
jgi:hypothetical protein